MSPSRTTLAVMLCAATAGIAGCERKSVMATPGEGHQTGPVSGASAPAPAGSQLWRIEVVSDGKIVSQQDICTDQSLRAGFARPSPELNGKPCVRVGQAVETSDTYAVRCNIDNQQYRVGSVTKGDPARDFTVEMTVAAQGRTGPSFEQVRHYRLLGSCPLGWLIADAAPPGATRLTNALTGAVRAASKPAP